MQTKISPENVEKMLQKGKFEVSYRTANQIEAKKPFGYGRIHMRLKREKSRYSMQERYYWLASFHFEKGLRPERFFDSENVSDFAENYVLPYAETK